MIIATIIDQYNVALNMSLKTDVPAPVIIVDPPIINFTMSGGQTAYAQYSLTNRGLVSAKNFKLRFSGDAEIQLSLPFDVIPEIKAGQTVTVPIKLTLAKASCHPGTISQDYGYICAAGNDVTAQAEPVQISAGWCETSPEPPQPSNPGAAPAPVVATPVVIGLPPNPGKYFPPKPMPSPIVPISPTQPGCKTVRQCDLLDRISNPDKLDDDGNVLVWLNICQYDCCGIPVNFSFKSNNPECPIRFCIE